MYYIYLLHSPRDLLWQNQILQRRDMRCNLPEKERLLEVQVELQAVIFYIKELQSMDDSLVDIWGTLR